VHELHTGEDILGGLERFESQHGTGVYPENLKLFIDLTCCEFLLMLDQWIPLSSDMSW
jgi:hypothetical protein